VVDKFEDMESEVILPIKPTGNEMFDEGRRSRHLSLMRTMKRLFARPINTGSSSNVAAQTCGRQILRHGEPSYIANKAYWQ
jgi:hypothetical protein